MLKQTLMVLTVAVTMSILALPAVAAPAPAVLKKPAPDQVIFADYATNPAGSDPTVTDNSGDSSNDTSAMSANNDNSVTDDDADPNDNTNSTY